MSQGPRPVREGKINAIRRASEMEKRYTVTVVTIEPKPSESGEIGNEIVTSEYQNCPLPGISQATGELMIHSESSSTLYFIPRGKVVRWEARENKVQVR